MAPQKTYKKKYYKKPTQSKKVGRLTKQVKSLQIQNRPELKFISNFYTL